MGGETHLEQLAGSCIGSRAVDRSLGAGDPRDQIGDKGKQQGKKTGMGWTWSPPFQSAGCNPPSLPPDRTVTHSRLALVVRRLCLDLWLLCCHPLLIAVGDSPPLPPSLVAACLSSLSVIYVQYHSVYTGCWEQHGLCKAAGATVQSSKKHINTARNRDREIATNYYIAVIIVYKESCTTY